MTKTDMYNEWVRMFNDEVWERKHAYTERQKADRYDAMLTLMQQTLTIQEIQLNKVD